MRTVALVVGILVVIIVLIASRHPTSRFLQDRSNNISASIAQRVSDAQAPCVTAALSPAGADFEIAVVCTNGILDATRDIQRLEHEQSAGETTLSAMLAAEGALASQLARYYQLEPTAQAPSTIPRVRRRLAECAEDIRTAIDRHQVSNSGRCTSPPD